MNKFVLLSFLVMGWVFYEMSGGANFEPRPRPEPEAVTDDTTTTGNNASVVAARTRPITANPSAEQTEANTPPAVNANSTRDQLTSAASEAVAPVITEVAVNDADAVTETDLSGAQTSDLASLFPLTETNAPGDSPASLEISSDTQFGVSPLNTFAPNANVTDANDTDAGVGAAIETALETALEDAPPQPDIREVTGSRVNMRSGPGTQYDVVARLTLGDDVEILLDPGTGWVQLRPLDGGPVGWMADFLISDG